MLDLEFSLLTLSILRFEIAPCNENTCNIDGENCTDGICRCGVAKTCEGNSSGSHCDAPNSVCKCSNYVDSCSPQEICNGTLCKCGSSESCDGKITGSFCDADNSHCKCASDIDACPEGVECKSGVCGKF